MSHELRFSDIVRHCEDESPHLVRSLLSSPEGYEATGLNLGGCIDSSQIIDEWDPFRKNLALIYPISETKTKTRTIKLPQFCDYGGFRITKEASISDPNVRIEYFFQR